MIILIDLFYEINLLSILAKRIKSTSTTEGIATKCCIEGCNYDYLRSFCCFTIECLRFCYPNSNYTENDALVVR